jgi:hypothetical protein
VVRLLLIFVPFLPYTTLRGGVECLPIEIGSKGKGGKSCSSFVLRGLHSSEIHVRSRSSLFPRMSVVRWRLNDAPLQRASLRGAR